MILSGATHTILSTWPSGGSTVKVVSSVAETADREITIQGVDSAGALLEEKVTILAGATEATTTNTFYSVHAVYKSATDGKITVQWYDSVNLVWTDYVVLEASDTRFTDGVKVDTTLTDDSEDSVHLDGFREFASFSLNINRDIPCGRYKLFIRAKQSSATATNDLGIDVWNQTHYPDRLNIPPEYVVTTVSTSWSYYSVLIDCPELVKGDRLEIFLLKATEALNRIWIDYVAICPINNGNDWPQDIAHNFLCGVKVKFEVSEK